MLGHLNVTLCNAVRSVGRYLLKYSHLSRQPR